MPGPVRRRAALALSTSTVKNRQLILTRQARSGSSPLTGPSLAAVGHEVVRRSAFPWVDLSRTRLPAAPRTGGATRRSARGPRGAPAPRSDKRSGYLAAAVVGELGVVQAERAQLAEDVAAASTRGRELVAAAEAEAARLFAAAQDLVAAADQRTSTPQRQGPALLELAWRSCAPTPAIRSGRSYFQAGRRDTSAPDPSRACRTPLIPDRRLSTYR